MGPIHVSQRQWTHSSVMGPVQVSGVSGSTLLDGSYTSQLASVDPHFCDGSYTSQSASVGPHFCNGSYTSQSVDRHFVLSHVVSLPLTNKEGCVYLK